MPLNGHSSLVYVVKKNIYFKVRTQFVSMEDRSQKLRNSNNYINLIKESVIQSFNTKVITYEVIFNGTSCPTGQKH